MLTGKFRRGEAGRAEALGGPRSLAQLTSNLDALSLALSPEQIDRLDAVSALAPSKLARRVVAWGDDARRDRVVA
jgi:aryl-alcohol dehydrogenase-like predicted oxidoreductase